MEKLKTIVSFDLPHEAHFAKTKLESEGIKVYLKDELTVQVDNFISNAIGGVKLQVFESDLKRASEILMKAGFIKTKNVEFEPYESNLSKLTSKIPLIGRLAFEVRMLVVLAILVIATLVPIVLLSLPSKIELITSETWYLNTIRYNGKHYKLQTNELQLVLSNGYSENIKFYENGTVRMPGFNTPSIEAKWKLENNKLIIFESDTLNYIYDGSYEMNVNSNSISLESKSTKIVGRIGRVRLF
ncbi:hypothetical protein DF185_03005 [Marinifilum breve]|uniref:DUF2007 domain-containing protein n=1 Tax=Marinifilum breve TaxID=2184082 RepID=A0A2V4AG46_9BACT|nr:DUF2007 domain-containing protein [Marinifilum breve]PXY03074.1 hypothetical protein DF185_03005 [Marinifilum breve]